MLIKSILEFYKRLVKDKQFRTKLENASNPEECQQAIREAGYNFTPEEFESATAEILSKNKIRDLDVSLSNVSDEELEVVFGGVWSRYWNWKPWKPWKPPIIDDPIIQPHYGGIVIDPPEDDHPPISIDPPDAIALYGIPVGDFDLQVDTDFGGTLE